MTNPFMQSLVSLQIHSSARTLGETAAECIAEELHRRLATQATVRMIFAAAPSQLAMLCALREKAGIDWQRVDAFHMDEYVGLPHDAPQRFGNWLRRTFFDHVPLRSVHLIEPEGDDAAIRYTSALAASPIDIVCLGIGMNGHLAFNDPPANFTESEDVRVVALDEQSRMQQVKEGLFATINDVPTHALTLSIPRLLRAQKLYCCVSGTMKKDAVARALLGEIDPSSPASILREHAGVVIFLDTEAAAGLAVKG